MVRYVHLPAGEVDRGLLEDASRRGEFDTAPLFELLLLGKGTWGNGRKRRRAVFLFFKFVSKLEADELCVFVCYRSCESGWEGEMR